MKVITINASNFDSEVLNSTQPVLLDFWASWCGPCKMMGPVVEEIAAEHPEIKVGKVNVDDEASLAIRFGITSIPTLVVMKNGKIENQSVGFVSKQAVLDLLK